MNKYFLIFSIIVLSAKLLYAQSFSGIVIDRDSQEPLPYANVFIEGTLKGTISNVNGRFALNIDRNITSPVVISFIGYHTRVLSLAELEAQPVVGLEKKLESIQEIDVKSNPSGLSREKMMRRFKYEFLGSSSNAESCLIKNEDDIYLFYNSETKVLHAHSQTPIIIENQLLGLNVYYLLENFRMSNTGIQFTGYCRFEEHEVKNKLRKNKIQQQRMETYRGSTMHFIRFLFETDSAQNDTVYNLEEIVQLYNFYVYGQMELDESLKDALNSQSAAARKRGEEMFLRKYENKFLIFNTRNEFVAPRNLILESEGKREIFAADTLRIFYIGYLQESMMVVKSGLVEIFKNGYYNPTQIRWGGTMSNQRVGDLLPLEYIYKSPALNKQD